MHSNILSTFLFRREDADHLSDALRKERSYVRRETAQTPDPQSEKYQSRSSTIPVQITAAPFHCLHESLCIAASLFNDYSCSLMIHLMTDSLEQQIVVNASG